MVDDQKINPNIRNHFVPFILLTKNKINYQIDQSTKAIPNINTLIQTNDITTLLKQTLTCNFNELKDKLHDLEVLLNNENASDSSSMIKKKQTEDYKKITQVYHTKEIEYSKEIHDFFLLKSKNHVPKSLIETSNIMKQAKNIITRFPPEPSGFLHLGHAKAVLLNDHFATENNGSLIVRFDDTNPLKEEQLFVDSILDDLTNLLKIKNFTVTYTSNYFERIIEYAVYLIKKELAYCDNTELTIMRGQRMDGIESKCRNTSIEDNLKIFTGMNQGDNKDYCLRAKIDMINVNKALRDPVILRCVDVPHHRTGDKYKIYPTYDFACPIVDSLEKVTHPLRTNEYRDRNQQYYWFIKNLDLEHKPKIKDFSRLVFENTVLSKRKLKNIVENNKIGWDDPRMPTLRGIKRLGMNFDVLKEYILLQGASQKNCKVSWDKIWAMNKKKIDNVSGKYFGIEKDGMREIYIENFGEMKDVLIKKDNDEVDNALGKLSMDGFYIELVKNKKNSGMGNKLVNVSKELFIPDDYLIVNDEITLMNLGNFVVKSVDDRKIRVSYKKDGDFKCTKLKLQWISKNSFVEVKMIEYGNLCKNEEGEFNEDSMDEKLFICEKEVGTVMDGDVIQIERIGFYYCDNGRFNLIPFTKQIRKK